MSGTRYVIDGIRNCKNARASRTLDQGNRKLVLIRPINGDLRQRNTR